MQGGWGFRRARLLAHLAFALGAAAGAMLLQASAALAAPGNDAFPGTTISLGTSYYVQTSESTVGATSSSGDPLPSATDSIGATVWYTWTAPDYPLQVTATTDAYTSVYGNQLQTASDFDTVLGVYYIGLDFQLHEVTSSDDNGGNPYSYQSTVTFTAVPSATYRFEVGGYSGASGNLNFLLAVRPPNDNFSAATALTGSGATFDGSLAGATVQNNEPNLNLFTPGSEWYSYTPSTDGYLDLSLTNTATEVGMSLQQGTAVDQLTQVGSTSGSTIHQKLLGGQTYYIQLYGLLHGFTLQWAFTPIPLNDNFANAQALSGTSGSASGTTFGASLENGEPVPFLLDCCSVWYTWTAPESGWVTPTLTSGANRVGFDVWQGSDLGHLTSVGVNGAGEFHATQNQVYYYQVIGLQDTFTLSWTQDASPANDDFANAQVIPITGGSPGTIPGTTSQASGESGEPNVGASVVSDWYSWTPSVNGDASISVSGLAGAQVAVYTGADVASLSAVDGPSASLDLRVANGTTYMIQVTSSISTEGSFNLAMGLQPAPANDNFADAAAFAMGVGTPGDVIGTLAHASSQSGEPNGDGQLTVWYAWTPSLTGESEIDSVTSNVNVAVYQGPDLADLTQVVAPTDLAQWVAQAGQAYMIQVSTPGTGGAFELQNLEYESDLATTLSGPATGSVGSQLTYSATVANAGPQPTTVQYTLSPSFPVRLNSFTSAASCAAQGGGVLRCTKLLASGSSFSVKYRIGAPVAGTLVITGGVVSLDNAADPTPANTTAVKSTTVNVVAGTKYTSVTDNGFTDAKITLGHVGGTVFWNNLGPSGNEVTDGSGLGLFDLNLGAPVDFGSYQYWASGTYLVTSPPDDTTQTIVVPLNHSPAAGGVTTTFVLTWAAYQAPTGYQYELDIKRPGTTLWQDWQTTGLKSGQFTPDRGTGTYQFRARLFIPGTLHASGWATTKIVVS